MTGLNNQNAAARGGASRVLVVDDDDKSLSAICMVLQQSGFEHEGAADGLTGISMVKSWQPDIVLLDVIMPGLDGVEVCRQIKADPAMRHIPVISLTANSDRETKMRCLDAGASDFLTKPIDYPELVMKVRNHLWLREFESLRKEHELIAASLSTAEAARQETERLYHFHKSVVDSMQDGVAIIDAENYIVVSANTALLEETGLTEQDIIGKPCYRVLHGNDEVCAPPGCPCPIREVRETGRHSTVEHIHQGRGDEKLYVEVSVSPIIDSSGRILQFVHLSRNITERRRMENELRKARKDAEQRHLELTEMFRKVDHAKEEWEGTMDCINDIVMLIDMEGKIVRSNNALKRFSGLDYPEIIGKSWETLVLDAPADAGLLATGLTEVYQGSIQRWLTINAYPFRDRFTQQTTGQVISVRDTTEVKNLTQSLEQTNTVIDKERGELKEALDQLSGLIQQVMDTKNLSIRYPNTQLQRCYEVMHCGKTSCACYGKESMRCWQVAGTYCGGKVSGDFAQKFGNCSNCPVYGSATAESVLQIGEHFNNMMHMLEDKNLELQSAYCDLQSAQSQALQQDKMASIGQLAAGVAHEINNPVGFVMSNLVTLQKYLEKLTRFMNAQTAALTGKWGGSDRSPEQMEALRRELKIDHILDDTGPLIKESLEGAERVKKIVQDLKGISRIDEAEWKLSNVNEGIESTLNIVWNELKYKAKVNREYGDIPQTICNMGQLNQVFMNLLVNSGHAIEKQGEITVRTWQQESDILVALSDTGCGIPQEIQQRIFEPFFTTKEVGKGTGLGLSIAYDIIKKHKGDISIQSELGKGTTFTVRIPIVQKG